MYQYLGSFIIGGCALLASLIATSVALCASNRQIRLGRIQREDEKRKEASKAFLDEARLLLERAYETFARCYGSTGIPQDDPHHWLSTARMIVRFQKMRQRLTEPEHLDIADEH
ncbi:MAG: hypothetical protein WBG50_01130 [Desulfomonilaceae bacterium]